MKETGDWWCGGMNGLKSEELKTIFFLPFLNQILKIPSELRYFFMNELDRRLSINQDSYAEIKIMEIYTHNISHEEFQILCKDREREYFDIYFKILQKVEAEQNRERGHWYYSTDYWPYGFIEKAEGIFSDIIALKLSELISKDDFKGVLLLSNNRLLQTISLVDFARIIINSDLDFISFLITNVAKKELKWAQKSVLFEFEFNTPDDIERISQLISKKLVKILTELDDKKTDAVVGLGFSRYIHFRDFIKLSPEIKKHFFIIAHKNNLKYHNGERVNFNWQQGQIKHLESRFILQHAFDIIKEGDIKKLNTLFYWDSWLSLLNAEDFLTLWNDPSNSLYDVLLKINRGIDPYNESTHISPERLKIVKNHLKEKVTKTINEGIERDIRVLFKLKFIDSLLEDDIKLLLKNLSFVELVYKLKRHLSTDSEVGKEVYAFFDKYESLLDTNLKPMIIEKLKEDSLEEVFKMLDYGWPSKISDNELCEILERKDLQFFKKMLKTVHYLGYEEESEIVRTPFVGHFIKMSTKVRDVLKSHVTEVIKSGNMNEIIPLIGAHYLEILDVEEIMALIKDKKVRLIDIVTKASLDHDNELYYYNERFFNWMDRFNNFLYKFDYTSELIPRSGSLLEYLMPSRYDPKFGMNSVSRNMKGIKNDGFVKIAGSSFYVIEGFLDLKNFFLQDLIKVRGLFSLKTLKHLDISFNWITEIPDKIEKLQSLEKLRILESRLQHLPESIGRLKNLKLLDVQGNLLETLPKSLESSESLETVLLSVFKYGDHSKLDSAIKDLRDKGITVEVHDLHWLN